MYSLDVTARAQRLNRATGGATVGRFEKRAADISQANFFQYSNHSQYFRNSGIYLKEYIHAFVVLEGEGDNRMPERE